MTSLATGRSSTSWPAAPSRRFVLGCVLLAAALHLLSALCSSGFLQADEHFQLLEFAEWKLGRDPAADLPWEFPRRMRPSLQPTIACGFILAAGAVGVSDPFVIASALRVTSAALGLWAALLLFFRFARRLESKALVRALLLALCFFWPMAFLRARYSSEGWASSLLVLGIVALERALESPPRPAHGFGFTSGLLLALSFFCRFQVGFSVLGIMLWLVLIRRAPRGLLAAVVAGGALGLGANLLLDHWFYGQWVLTPVRYLQANIIEDRASAWGRLPFWYYPEVLLEVMLPPFSLLFGAALLVAVWKRPRELLVWAALPFLLGHMAVGHKEARFLIPLMDLIPPLVVLGLEALQGEPRRLLLAFARSALGRLALAGLIGLDLLVLVPASLRPLRPQVVLQRWFYQRARSGPVEVWSKEVDLYGRPTLAMSFYAAPAVHTRVFADDAALVSALRKTRGPIFVLEKGLDPPPALRAPALACRVAFRTLPAWLVPRPQRRFTGWLKPWSVYRCRDR